MKRRLHPYYLLVVSTVAMALGGCASIVTPAPRVIAIVVPATPPPVAILPPAPAGLRVRPLFTDIAWPSGWRPEIAAPPSSYRDGASCLQNDDSGRSCRTMSM